MATDAIVLLKEDHKKVKGLLGDLEKSSMRAGPRAQKLVTQIDKELEIHTAIEEEIFYPAMRKFDAGVVEKSIPEHNEMRRLIARLRESYRLTSILVSHDLAVVAHLCNRIAIMREGRLVELLEPAARSAAYSPRAAVRRRGPRSP